MTEPNVVTGRPQKRAETKTVAVVGFGNIGTGVIELLYQKGVA